MKQKTNGFSRDLGEVLFNCAFSTAKEKIGFLTHYAANKKLDQ